MLKSSHRKPRIAIALPGINYVPDTPYVLNTLPFLPYLQQDFEVTLIFRALLHSDGPAVRYQTILSRADGATQQKDVYFSPAGVANALEYIQQINRFAKAHAHEFDLVLERQWSLVGALSSAFNRYGVPTVAVHEAEYYGQSFIQSSWRQSWPRRASGLALKHLLPRLRKRWMRQASSLVVETEEMKQFLWSHQYVEPTKSIAAIPNGINPAHFYPGDRPQARAKLGLSQDAVILAYVGSLNRFLQEPAPLIEAIATAAVPRLELHLVGDGKKRQELERLAQQLNAPVVFHGKRPQQELGDYIAAANLCVAPYNKGLFPDGEFTPASLKVCEYLACGRPVLTIPCSRMAYMLQNGRYGFLVENTAASYIQFLQKFPASDELAGVENRLLDDLQHSILRERGIVLLWSDIADLYRQVFQAALGAAPLNSF